MDGKRHWYDDLKSVGMDRILILVLCSNYSANDGKYYVTYCVVVMKRGANGKED